MIIVCTCGFVWLETWSLGLRKKASLSKCVLRIVSEPKINVVMGFQEILYNEYNEEER
jgi:hypothetical protein